MLRAEKLVLFCSFSPCDASVKEKFANFALHLMNTMEKHSCLDDSPTLRMIALDEVDSTNNFLRHLDTSDDRRMTLVTAEFQSAGRGSGENRWESAKGENLLFSLRVMPRNLPVRRMFAISEATALAIRESLTLTLSKGEEILPLAPCPLPLTPCSLLLAPLSYRFKQEYGCTYRYIQRVECAQHRNANMCIGSLAPYFRQSRRFCPHHQCRCTTHISVIIQVGIL